MESIEDLKREKRELEKKISKLEREKQAALEARKKINDFIAGNPSLHIKDLKEIFIPSSRVFADASRTMIYKNPLAKYSNINILQLAEIYKRLSQIHGRKTDYIVTGKLYLPEKYGYYVI